MDRAIVAACLLGLAAFAHADDAQGAGFSPSDAKQVFFPTTTNDYGSMIYSLLEEQVKFIAAKDGADVSPRAPPLPCMRVTVSHQSLPLPCHPPQPAPCA